MSQQVEALLDSGERNGVTDFLGQESRRLIEAKGATPSSYDIFAVRRNDQFGEEIFGPKQLHVGSYSEEMLYGAAGSPVTRFRLAIEALKARVEKTITISPEEVEYGHQVALFWAEAGKLKEFIGTSSAVSEIVAEFRTARFQFLGKDTPIVTMKAISSALRLVAEAKIFNSTLVDRVVEALETGNIDPLAPDVLRDTNA
jgi:hypothetical protein